MVLVFIWSGSSRFLAFSTGLYWRIFRFKGPHIPLPIFKSLFQIPQTIGVKLSKQRFELFKQYGMVLDYFGQLNKIHCD